MVFRLDREFRQELGQNWPLLAIAFLCFLVSLQLTSYVLPFVYPKVIETFGWTREQATFISSIKYIIGAVAGILVGRMSDRISPWVLLIVANIFSGLSLISFLWMDNLETYYAIGIIQGICVPGGYIAMMIVIARAFVRSQGSATGFVLIGSTVCSIIAPVAVTFAMEAWGWRWGVAAMSLGIWLVVLPLLVFAATTKNRSLADAGAAKRAAGDVNAAAGKADSQPTGAVMRELFKSRDFWLISVAIFLAALADQGFRQHQVLIFNDLGIDSTTTALIISGIGVAGVFARIIAGNLLDSRSNKGLAFLFAFEAVASVLAFFLLFPGVVLVYALLRAFSHAALTLDTSVMGKHVFGVQNLGTVIGILAAVGGLGSAAGPWVMGVIFDTFGTYSYAFVLFTFLPLIGAWCAWITTPHYWLSQNAKQNAAPAAEA